MRIAQLTDLHLRHHLWGPCPAPRRRSHHMPDLLQAALARIKQHNVDLLAVTGDLLDVPLWIEKPIPGFQYSDRDAWRQAAIKDYQFIRRLLDESQLPHVVLPGNHDAPSLMWEVFDPIPNEIEIDGWRVARFCDHEHERNQPHRYVPERLRWDTLTAATDGPPQIHLQHYVIDAPLSQGYPYTYAEADFLRSTLAASSRVKLCLSGHYHHGVELTRDGTCWFAVAPALSESPYRWCEYEISDDGEHCNAVTHELGANALPTRPVVFLDRDGVINDRASYHAGPEKMRLIPGAANAIRQLNQAGRAVVVITNQTAVGHGMVPPKVVYAVNDRMARLLFEEAGATLDAIYAAFATPDSIFPTTEDPPRFKPHPTMLRQAAEDLKLDLTDAWMVGDAITDAMAGHAAGATPILVRTGHGPNHEPQFREKFPDAPVTENLGDAIRIILASQ